MRRGGGMLFIYFFTLELEWSYFLTPLGSLNNGCGDWGVGVAQMQDCLHVGYLNPGKPRALGVRALGRFLGLLGATRP